MNPTYLVESTSAAEPIQLSGETMFEMEESGPVRTPPISDEIGFLESFLSFKEYCTLMYHELKHKQCSSLGFSNMIYDPNSFYKKVGINCKINAPLLVFQFLCRLRYNVQPLSHTREENLPPYLVFSDRISNIVNSMANGAPA